MGASFSVRGSCVYICTHTHAGAFQCQRALSTPLYNPRSAPTIGLKTIRGRLDCVIHRAAAFEMEKKACIFAAAHPRDSTAASAREVRTYAPIVGTHAHALTSRHYRRAFVIYTFERQARGRIRLSNTHASVCIYKKIFKSIYMDAEEL